jgi:hypothetical protein
MERLVLRSHSAAKMLHGLILRRDQVIAENAPQGTHDQHRYPDVNAKFNVFHLSFQTREDGLPGILYGRWPGYRVSRRFPVLPHSGVYSNNTCLNDGTSISGGQFAIPANRIQPVLFMPVRTEYVLYDMGGFGGSVIDPDLMQVYPVGFACIPSAHDTPRATMIKVDYLFLYDGVLPSAHDPIGLPGCGTA